MNRKGAILALDIGTSSSRPVVLTPRTGWSVHQSQLRLRNLRMAVQIDPEKIWTAFLTVVKRMAGHLGGIDLIVPALSAPLSSLWIEKGSPLSSDPPLGPSERRAGPEGTRPYREGPFS